MRFRSGSYPRYERAGESDCASLAAGEIAFQVHRAARLVDSAHWFERNRAGEHDLSGRRQIERYDRRALIQRLKQSRLQRPLLFANPPDLVLLVVRRRRESANLEHRSTLRMAERDGAAGGRRCSETGQAHYSRIGADTG